MTLRLRIPTVCLSSLLAVILLAGVASAGPFQDITNGFGDAIGVSEYVAEFMLSMAMLLSFGMALGFARLPPVATMILMLGGIGVFVAIGWLDAWVLILGAVLVAVVFGSMVKNGMVAG